MKIFGYYLFEKSFDKDSIVQAIRDAELGTTGEIRVHISRSFFEKDLLTSAQNQFEYLKMHETKDRNGVLFYFNLRRHQFALFGDIGIHEKVKQDFWNRLATDISKTIHNKGLNEALVKSVEEIGKALKTHFPGTPTSHNPNELSNEVSEA